MADSSQQHDWPDSLRLLFEWLKDPTTLGLLGLFIGLLGVVLGFVFYLKSRRIKKPRYAMQSTNLVKNYVSRLDGVEITYHQKKISNLTVTKIAIWNDGNETIDRNDVASSDPVTIRIKKDYQILDASIIHSTDKTNCFKLLAKENGLIQISFDYIDHFQGIIVQILHDGRSSHDLTIEGTIKGAGKIVENRFLVPYLRSPSSGVKKHNVILALICFALPILWIAGMVLLPSKFEAWSVKSILAAVFNLFSYSLIGLFFLGFGGASVPRGFEMFTEEVGRFPDARFRKTQDNALPVKEGNG